MNPLVRLRDWRNRLLASSSFRLRAAQWPLIRQLARRRARELFDLMTGFVASQVLVACVQLDLMPRLLRQPATASVLAKELGLPPERLRRLLQAACVLGLLESREAASEGEHLYALGAAGATLAGDQGLQAMILHQQALYQDLVDPVALLRDPARPTLMEACWPYAAARGEAVDKQGADAAAVAGYTSLMAATQGMVAQQVLRAYPFSGNERLLDLGGGDGSFLLAVAENQPSMALTLVDLPPVAELARQRLAGHPLGERIDVRTADFNADALPQGSNLVSLVRILHDHDDAVVSHLLQKVHDCLAPGGRVLIAEPLAATPGAERVGAVYFGFYLLAMGSGRPRRFKELSELLRAAGFSPPRRHRVDLPLVCSVISAERGP